MFLPSLPSRTPKLVAIIILILWRETNTAIIPEQAATWGDCASPHLPKSTNSLLIRLLTSVALWSRWSPLYIARRDGVGVGVFATVAERVERRRACEGKV